MLGGQAIEDTARFAGQRKQFMTQEPATRNLAALFALAAFALLSPTTARTAPPTKPPPLSAADKAHILGDTFTVVRTVKQIPAAVQKALGLHAKDPLNGMADAGQKFQESDFIQDPKLPFRRLVFAAVNARYCLVYYELGGIAYRHEVALYRLQGGKAVAAWRGELNSAYRPATLAQLRLVIQHGKYNQSNY